MFWKFIFNSPEIFVVILFLDRKMFLDDVLKILASHEQTLAGEFYGSHGCIEPNLYPSSTIESNTNKSSPIQRKSVLIILLLP